MAACAESRKSFLVGASTRGRNRAHCFSNACGCAGRWGTQGNRMGSARLQRIAFAGREPSDAVSFWNRSIEAGTRTPGNTALLIDNQVVGDVRVINVQSEVE